MPRLRQIAGLFAVAATLGGCGVSQFANLPVADVSANRTQVWQDFLPVEIILTSSPTDFERAMAEIRAVRARASRLKRRARMLSQPVSDAYDQISAE